MTGRRTEGESFRIQDDETPSDTVLRAVEAASERPVMDLPPLQDSIDVESLNRLFVSSTVQSIQFEYYRLNVTVEQNQVTLEEQ